MLDVSDREISLGDKVGIAFARASSAHIRTGQITQMHSEFDQIKILWDEDGKESPWVNVYAHGVNSWRRVIILNG